MTNPIELLEQRQLRSDLPVFKAGDTVRVHFQVIEGQRRRVQVFEGIVIKRQGAGVRETFTVRKQSFGVESSARSAPLAEDREDRGAGDRRRQPRQALLLARESGEEGACPRGAAGGRGILGACRGRASADGDEPVDEQPAVEESVDEQPVAEEAVGAEPEAEEPAPADEDGAEAAEVRPKARRSLRRRG